jgi:hypothetical protein
MWTITVQPYWYSWTQSIPYLGNPQNFQCTAYAYQGTSSTSYPQPSNITTTITFTSSNVTEQDVGVMVPSGGSIALICWNVPYGVGIANLNWNQSQ